MQRSLFTAVSGLRNHQVKMDVIGNNIANVNTTAFKGGRVRFQDILSQNIRSASAPQLGMGGINPAQVGLGMSIGAIDTIHSQGSLQNTGRSTDLAIQGNGFFVMSDGINRFYTRDGAFSVGADGDLVNSANGFKPLGWAADAAGKIDTNLPLSALNIPIGNRVNTRATENLVLGGNLDALTALQPRGSFNVTDSLNRTHTVDVALTRAADNAWSWTASSGTLAMTGNSGTATFDANGNLTASTGGPIRFTPPGLEPVVVPPNFSLLTADMAMPIASPEPHTAEFTVQDSFDRQHTVEVTFTNTGENTWSWIATSGTLAMTGNGGTVTFDATGNLTASTGCPISFTPLGPEPIIACLDFSALTADMAMPIASPEPHTAEFAVQDSFDRQHTVEVTFTNTGENTWSWIATSGTLAMTGNSGTVTFDATGNLTASTGGPISFTPPGPEPGVVPLDFSALTADMATPITSLEPHTAEFNVTDALNRSHIVEVTFTNTGENTWSWIATSGTLAMTGNNGTVTFDATGNLTASTGGPISLTPPGADLIEAPFTFPSLPANASTSHTTEVVAYDSQGGMHTVAIALTKTAANSWRWAATSGTHAMTAGSSGTLTFDAAGNLTASTGGPIGFAPPGVAALSIAPDFSGLSQVVGRSSALVRSQNGFPVGELESFAISNTGVISGIYTNGLVVPLGQVALAGFPNPEGLQKTAANMFQISSNSGQPRIGGAGLEGRGSIETATLEMSNVDLSVEFTEMITTSRAFQANSRMISASDELLQEVVNLKR